MSGGVRKKVGGSIREIVFGMEDSLVSMLGAVTGVAASTHSTTLVLLTGSVLVVVEALSMSAGSYLSSKSAKELYALRHKQDAARLLQERISDDESLHDALKRKRFSEKDIENILGALARERKVWLKEVKRHEYRMLPSVAGSPVWSAFMMGGFFLLGGIFPLLPYMFLPINYALAPSILLTAAILFLLGVFKAKVVNGHWLKSGFEMASISLAAAILGFLVGKLAGLFFGVTI